VHRPGVVRRVDRRPRGQRAGRRPTGRARGGHPPAEGRAAMSDTGFVRSGGGRVSSDRLPRLLALVPYLMSHPGAQVSEVARLFGLTEKQLIDDLQLVWMCGLPGHTPGDLIDVSWDGGEILIDNADTIARPLRLGVDEASALLVALRMLGELPEFQGRDVLARVTAKLERAAAEGAAAVSSQVQIDMGPAPGA